MPWLIFFPNLSSILYLQKEPPYRRNHAPAETAAVITADDDSWDDALAPVVPGVEAGSFEDFGILLDLGVLVSFGAFVAFGALVDLSVRTLWLAAETEKMVKRRARIWKSFMIVGLKLYISMLMKKSDQLMCT